MKYLKMSGNILLYIIIYLLTQMVSGLVFGVIAAVTMQTKYGYANGVSHVNQLMSKYIFVIVVIGAIAALVIFILLFRNKDENLFQRCKFNKMANKDVIKSIVAAIGVTFVGISFIAITEGILGDYSKVSNQISQGQQSFFGIISVIILIPIFEEILFRGIIFNELRKNINIVASVIIQALIFGIAHGNIIQGGYTFILGVIAALVYIWTKSIFANITVHITFNLFGSIIIPLVTRYIDAYFKYSKIPEVGILVVYTVVGVALMTIGLATLYKKKNRKGSGQFA